MVDVNGVVSDITSSIKWIVHANIEVDCNFQTNFIQCNDKGLFV